MRKNGWKCKMLAGILCASLVFQSVSVTAFAEEGTQEVQTEEVADNTATETEEEEASKQQETEQKETEQASELETQVQEKQTETTSESPFAVEESTATAESSTEAASEEITESETEIATEEEAEETNAEELQAEEETRIFDEVKIDFCGFTAYVESIRLKKEASDCSCDFNIIQYKGDKVLGNNTVSAYEDGNYYRIEYPYHIGMYKATTHMSVEAKVYDSDGNCTEVSSDLMERTNQVTNLSFSVQNVSTGAGTLKFDLSYVGDLKIGKSYGLDCAVDLYYGTGTDESDWQIATNRGHATFFDCPDDSEKTKMVVCGGIPSGQMLHGKLVVRVYPPYTDESGNQIYAYEQSILIDDFTVKEDKEYTLSEIFPDQVLQEKIKNIATVTGDTIKQSQLDTIKNIYAGRYHTNDAIIRDLSGIELLTNLTILDLTNHEISDVAKIRWERFTELEKLYLRGNDIAVLPDLTQNINLRYVDFMENLLPASETAQILKKLPEGYQGEYNVNNQRTERFRMIVEPMYYQYDGKSPVILKLDGYKTGLDSTIKISIDGNEVQFINNYGRFINSDTGLSVGKHTIKADLMVDNKTAESTDEAEFSIEKQQDAFPLEKQYYSQKEQSMWVTIYTMERENVQPVKAELVDKAGNIVAETIGFNVNEDLYDQDPRYKLVESSQIDGVQFVDSEMRFQPLKNVIPVGSYDVRLTLSDGTAVVAQDAIEIFTSDKPYIKSYSVGYDDCDSTGEYLYLAMGGNNIEPDWLNYNFMYDDIELRADYVSSKKTFDGVIAKLRKDNWTVDIESDRWIDVCVTPKSGYDIKIETNWGVYIEEGIFYSAYNPITGKVEAGLPSSLGKGEVTAELKEAWEESSKTIATATAQMGDDGLALFEMKNPDGTVWKPTASKSYYLYCTYEGRTYSDSFWTDGSTVSVNYWSVPQQVIQGNGEETWFYYYEGASYDKDAEYAGTITGDTISKPIAPTTVNAYNSDYNATVRTTIGLKYDLSALVAGTYTIKLTKNGAELAKYEFTVVANDRFILNSLNVWWENDDNIQIYVVTPNAKEGDDNYQVQLTDPFGNEVPGLTTKLDTRRGYSGRALYLNVTGLKRTDAYRKYYVKISHNKLGEAVKSDLTTPYFTDKGEMKEISLSRGGYSWIGDRLVGINMSGVQYPVQIMIYRSYNAEEVASISVTADEVTELNYYFFRKSLCDQLPDKDALYDIVAVDSGDWVSTWDNKNIGYSEPQTISWSYAVSATTLYLNNPEGSKATITVTGNKENPTFKSSDSNVVKVTASKENATVAELEATGLGTAEISITADGKTETVTVEVVKLSKLEGIAFDKESLTLETGKQGELILNATPAEAWEAAKTVEITSSDTGVVTVEKQEAPVGAAAKAVLTAVKEGTATITAIVKDGDKQYRAEAEITVGGSISNEEKDKEIAKVGTLYALTNNAKTLKDIVLPTGWEWISKSVQIDSDAREQYFLARFTRADGKSFIAQLPVAVATLEGIKAQTDGTGLLNPGRSIIYTLSYRFDGCHGISDTLLASSCEVKWDLSKGTIVTADATDKDRISLTAKEAGTQEITVTVKVGSDTFTDKVKVTVAEKESVNRIEVIPQKADTNGIDFTFENDEISVNAKEFKAEIADTVILSAKTFIDEKETATGVAWTSSDEGVATVTTAENITTLTFRKTGTAVISATASDDVKYSYSFKVSVKDYAPLFDNPKIIVNKNLGSVELVIFEQNGNRIRDIKVYEGANESKNYEVSAEGGSAILMLKADSALKNRTKSVKTSVTLQFDTEMGTYEQAAEVSLDVKKIPISVKQTKKPNIFYTDSEAIFEISSAYKISNVEEETKDAPGFHLISFDSKNGILTFASKGITTENYDKYKKSTVNLNVTFTDFEGSVMVPVTINTENKKPNLAINTVTIYNELQTELTTVIADKKTKEQYVLNKETNTHTFEPKLDGKGNGVTGVDISEDGCLKLKVKGSKAATYKVTISDSGWTQAITLSGKVASAKKPVLELGTNKVTLNMANSIEDNGYYYIPVFIKNGDMPVTDVTCDIDGNKETVVKLEKALHAEFKKESQQLEIGLKKEDIKTLKKGNYKITVKANAEGIGEAKSATFTLAIADKVAAVKLSAKGSINLADRAGTSIVYTPKLFNVSAAVEKVELTGTNADAFTAAVTEDGKIEVKAVHGFYLGTDVRYDLGMELTLDNDSKVKISEKIKPVNKLPKVKASVTKGTLYKVSDQKISANLIITQKAGQNFEIGRVRIAEDKNSKYFKLSYSSDGKVRVALSDKASELKAGKYTVKYNVFFKDAASNAKPVTMKMTVTVK